VLDGDQRQGCARFSPSMRRAAVGKRARCAGWRGCCGEIRPMPKRILWQALTTDRRFAGQFKRQTRSGRHIPDFVSFVHRLAI